MRPKHKSKGMLLTKTIAAEQSRWGYVLYAGLGSDGKQRWYQPPATQCLGKLRAPSKLLEREREWGEPGGSCMRNSGDCKNKGKHRRKTLTQALHSGQIRVLPISCVQSWA